MSAARVSRVALLATIALGGCSKTDFTHCAGVIYVAVALDGAVTVNGNPVAMDAINEKLSTLAPPAKYVLYYREHGQEELTAAQMSEIKRLMASLMRLNLPLSFSSRPDYSTVVDNTGAAQPRTSCPVES